MYQIVLAALAFGTLGAAATGLWARMDTARHNEAHRGEVAALTARHNAQLASSAEAARFAAARLYHPSRRPVGFDQHACEALAVAAKGDPKGAPKDPVTMPKQHPATCRCARCQTSSEWLAPLAAGGGSTEPARPREHTNNCGCDRCKQERPRSDAGWSGDGAKVQCRCGRRGCGGCFTDALAVYLDRLAPGDPLGLWVQLGVHSGFALALDEVLDGPEPATLVERSFR